MTKENRNYVKLGLFVIVATILFIVGVYNIGSKQNLFGSNFRISAIFKHVKGLQAGNNVRFSGINVGAIDDIIIENDSTLRVVMKIESNIRKHIKKDSEAYISSSSLVGDMVMNILPGTPGNAVVEPGDIIQTKERVDTDELVSSLDQTNKNIITITQNLVEITDKINSGEGLVSNLLTSEELTRHMQTTARNLNDISITLAHTSKELQTAITGIASGEGVIGYLLKDTSFATQTNEVFAKLDRQFIGKTDPILASLQQSTTNVETISKQIDSLVREVDLNKGMVGFLLNDSLTAKQTHQVLENTISGTDNFNQNMEALKHNILFRRYFKKQEKKRAKAAREKANE